MRRIALAALAAVSVLAAVFVAAFVTAIVLVAPVLAADKGGVVTAPAAPDEPNWNRSGLYAAVLAGYNTAVLKTEGIDLGNGKLMGGGAVGYNFRSGQYVWGLEADWLFTDLKASESVAGVTVTAANRHLASVRARAGIVFGPSLLYVTAGPAWQHAKVAASGGLGHDSVWQLGWSAGGGMELELSRSLAVRLEALHYRFENSGSPFDAFESQHTAARAGVIHKF